jgi:hypothetical protein
MKTFVKTLLFSALFMGMANYTNAQVVVRVRPAMPRVVVARPVAPSPRHVWVAEDWRPGRRNYRWSGNYWAAPPRPQAIWVPGHWVTRPRGYIWAPGHWR